MSQAPHKAGKLIGVLRSSGSSFFVGLFLAALAALLVWFPFPTPEAWTGTVFVVRYCAAIFGILLIDSLGGGWFGYAALFLPLVGLLNPNGNWLVVVPLLIGSCWVAMFVRHLEPNWTGTFLASLLFLLPLAGVLVLYEQLDPNLELPNAGLFPLLHGLAGAVALVLARFMDRLNRVGV